MFRRQRHHPARRLSRQFIRRDEKALRGKRDHRVRELPGVGDAAFSYDQNPGKTSHVVGIFTRTGPHVLTISMDVNTGNSVEALREDALVLTKAAIVKLK